LLPLPFDCNLFTLFRRFLCCVRVVVRLWAFRFRWREENRARFVCLVYCRSQLPRIPSLYRAACHHLLFAGGSPANAVPRCHWLRWWIPTRAGVSVAITILR